MTQGCPSIPPAQLLAPPRVRYDRRSVHEALADAGCLALFGFGAEAPAVDDPRYLRIALEPLATPAPLESWRVDDAVEHGRDGALRWSAGGGWLFFALELDEHDHGGPEATSALAYDRLCAFLAARPERHVQRLWNYLGSINEGDGDAERYKRFCEGRIRGMDGFFADGFPAATVIGHHLARPLLQVYGLACAGAGTRVENPRQLSPWRYPRQYGRTPPSFARAMQLHGGRTLAISGTASITGHASRHHGDLDAQLGETFANLRALLASAGLPESFGADAPLKAYVRDRDDVAAVDAAIAREAPDAPRLLLHGDVCRAELLVEIDGWRYAGEA